jgi:hypothetical protein
MTLVILVMLVAALGAITGRQSREQAQLTRRSAQALPAFVGGAALLWARRRSARLGGIAVRRGVGSRPSVLLSRLATT